MDSAYNLEREINRKYSSKSSQEKLESFLYSRGRKQNKFFTNDSCLYFDCNDEETVKTIKFRTNNKLFDSLNNRALNDYKKFANNTGILFTKYQDIVNKLNAYQEDFSEKKQTFLNSISVIRLWNTSILVAVIIGMISMSFIYRYLGQGVDAKDVANNKAVAGVMTEKKEDKKMTKEEEEKYVSELAKYLELEADKDFNIKVRELVKGYPIESFLPYLLDKDHEVVAFYIAIAKKESNWGKRVPVLNGEDCYNYVGYRGGGDRLGSGGHSCFVNRKEAVDVVSKRIEALIKDYGRDTAEEMVVWKCGNSCAATGGQAAANKWISDVKGILKELNN